ncbi:MAG: hypothetical protein ACI8QS_001979 [Planctomycetota bacterium]
MDKTKQIGTTPSRLAAGILLALISAGCGAGGGDGARGGGEGGEGGDDGGGGGGGGGGTGGSEDGGTAADIPVGALAAELEVSLPVNDSFILSGTFPIPKGVMLSTSTEVPYQIADYDGTLLDTQVEIVTRYPESNDGADVVEVIARVRRDPSLSSGMRAHYQVFRSNQAKRPDPGAAGVEDLQDGPVAVPSTVRDLLDDPRAIRVSATDCFGNEYSVYPLEGNGQNTEVRRYGHARAQLSTFETMAPDPVVDGPQGTLAHFFGVHSYISTYSEEELIGLDLRFNNAHSGIDTSTSMDDVLDTVYFDSIEVTIPSGWRLIQDFEDPYFGAPSTTQSGDQAFPIVKSIGDGTFHVIRWQGQFHRRLMITPINNGATAYAALQFAGQGFCQPAEEPVSGRTLYSWWNRTTSRYFPQSAQLPILPHITDLDGRMQTAFDDLKVLMNTGDGLGSYPVPYPVMGWGHPYGVQYAGMTGGTEIHIFDGVDVAYTANKSGLMNLLLTHRMHTDRMPLAIYDGDGTPSTVEDWLVTDGGGEAYVPFEHYILPFFNKTNPFNPGSAPQFQIDHVRGTGKTPYYEWDHMQYDPHDFQHYVRYTRSPKVLVWLANDMIAKDDLELVSEMYRLSYHPHRNNAGGGYIGTGLYSHLKNVIAEPAVGSPFGRGESWGIDSALASYASGDDETRARLRPWLDIIMNNLSDSQMCSGFLQTQISTKFLNGQYRGRQAIEQAITENVLRGALMTVYKDKDAAMSAVVEDVLERSLYAFISPMAWQPGELAPAPYSAIGPLDTTKPVYCGVNEMPSDGWEAGYEKYQNWSSFAYGYERTGDPIFLDQASIQLGGQDVLYGLELQAYSNVWNTAAILALAQSMNGDI